MQVEPLEVVDEEITEGKGEQEEETKIPEAVEIPNEITEEKKEFKLRAEEQQPILPPQKVGEVATDENANDPLQPDFEGNPKLTKLLKSKNLKVRLSKSGEEILAEIKIDPNKVGWRTRPRDWDWKHRSDIGKGKGVDKLFTCFKYSGWRFLCH